MELLVHVAASSSRKDDEKHKSQARNYHSFEPVNHVWIQQRRDETLDATAVPAELSQMSDLYNVEATGWKPAMLIEDTQLAVSALDSQLLTSSLRPDYTFPAVPRGLETGHDISRVTTHSPSSLSTQLSSPTARLGKRPRADSEQIEVPSRKSHVLGSPFVPICENRGLSIGYVGMQEAADESLSNSPTAVRETAAQPPTHSASWENDDIPSELPSSYSISDVTLGSNGPTDFQRSSGPAADEADAGTPSLAEAAHTGTGEGTRPVAANKTLEEGNLDTVEGVQSPNAVAAGPANLQDPPVSQEPRRNPEVAGLFKDLPLSISPPPPPTSTASFKTHVTPDLQSLATKSHLLNCYKPTLSVRKLRTSERGYWLINPHTWPAGLQVDFWRFLQQMIENSFAGWGIWCTRDPTNSTSTVPGLGTVMVFCWGEVVQHVYLMLYVASRSKVRKVGAAWIDADDHIVIQMA